MLADVDDDAFPYPCLMLECRIGLALTPAQLMGDAAP
jgi:hypothetical protein